MEDARCTATTREGRRCRMRNGLGKTGLCVWHDPDRADEATRMRRHGANASNARRRQGLDPEELGPLESVEDARRWLRVLASAVASGRLGVTAADVSVRGIRAWLSAVKMATDEEMSELRALRDELQTRRVK